MLHQVKTYKIKANPNNPRLIKGNKFRKLVQSIKDFPEMLKLRPIVVNKEMIVLGGNMRLKACIDAGLKEVWIAKAWELTPEQEQEFIVKDNSSFGEWDWDVLANEWDIKSLENWGVEGFPFEIEENELDEKYTEKIGEVIYEPKETNHNPNDLFIKENKFDKDIEKIKNNEIKEMLKLRTAFFTTFYFSKIADYYAYQANNNEKKIFEKLALVLLDKNQLIENGFSDLIDKIGKKGYE